MSRRSKISNSEGRSDWTHLPIWSNGVKRRVNGGKLKQAYLWRFQKTRQIWLLKNIYNIERLPVKHFKILRKYIKSMPEGPSKKVTWARSNAYRESLMKH